MRIVRLVGAACLAALLAGCGTAGGPQLSAVESSANPTVSQAARALDAAFGDRRTWPNGLAITISQPRSLQPSSTAYPRAARAAVFELTVENGTATTYKPSQLAVKATLGNQPAQEVVDPAQGLGGYVAAQEDLAPGKSVRLTVAFAMPQQPADLRILVQPDVVDAVPAAAFAGTA
ncbi:hypothetical protein [Kutzneria kofuensis]|uniref:DUF4352 domain-containing protein n=1 Tax=Kutzneria kofuensis TaxID=103725 RepID=A0A7W9KFG0_9PSEU|nr:hypothetical protein [Kutzneria kofuensis]MBB5891168.1 hypothetical protein [Kutzneria kofuensis]